MTLEIRGHDSGHRVKMNAATQTRSSRSACVTVRPDRSWKRKLAQRQCARPEIVGRASR